MFDQNPQKAMPTINFYNNILRQTEVLLCFLKILLNNNYIHLGIYFFRSYSLSKRQQSFSSHKQKNTAEFKELSSYKRYKPIKKSISYMQPMLMKYLLIFTV